MARFTVEQVHDRRGLRRILDLPDHLHRREPSWVPSVISVEEARLDPAGNRFFEHGDAAYFLARDRGRPVGRIVAHEHPDLGAGFGFFDAADDQALVEALLAAARGWLDERGCPAASGPRSFTPADGAGVRLEGHDVPAATGVPWSPARYAAQLEAAGCEPAEDLAWFRWVLDDRAGRPPTLRSGAEIEVPTGLEPYHDPRLSLSGAPGRVLAVPDVTGALAGVGFRSAWRAARKARAADFEGAVVVTVEGDPAQLVPAVVAAARSAGYRWLLAPWAPPDRRPVAVNRTFRLGGGGGSPLS